MGCTPFDSGVVEIHYRYANCQRPLFVSVSKANTYDALNTCIYAALSKQYVTYCIRHSGFAVKPTYLYVFFPRISFLNKFDGLNE